MEDVLASSPHISREDVLAALSFASELFKEETFIAWGRLPNESAPLNIVLSFDGTIY